MHTHSIVLVTLLCVTCVVCFVLLGLYIQTTQTVHQSKHELSKVQEYVDKHLTARAKIVPRSLVNAQKVLPVRTYWYGMFSRKQHGSIMSFLVHHPKLVVWVLLDTDTMDLNMANPWLESLQRTARVKVIPYHTDRRRHDANLPAKADVVRYSDLFRYGGLWFDLDVIWLKNVQSLIHGKRPWSYPWGRTADAGLNNAVMYSPQSHPAMLALLRTIDSYQRTALPVARYLVKEPFFFAQPLEYFDPSWDAPQGQFQCSDFFLARTDTPLPHVFFSRCYAYHWHGQWDAFIHEDSWFAHFERQNYQKLKWKPVHITTSRPKTNG